MKWTLGLNFQKSTSLGSRSGLSLAPVMLGGGVTDSDFQGVICVMLMNLSKWTIEIETGDSISQMHFLKKEEIEFVKVNELDKTEQGRKGFGSTCKWKMSKIIVKEFDVCHKFMESCLQHILPLNEREFVGLTHLVSCDEFVIFISYDKKIFGDKIQQFVQDIIKEA